MNTVVIALITLVGSALTSSGFLYLRENRESISVKTLSKTIEQLERDRDRQQDEIDELKRALRVSDAEKVGMEASLNIHKRAINAGVICEIPREKCPISLKLKELNNT